MTVHLRNLSLLITEPLRPTLELVVGEKAKNTARRVTVLIDTGFDDFLSIPIDLANQLGIIPLKQGLVELADGSDILVQIGIADIYFQDFPESIFNIPVIIDEGDECLIGTRLLSEICSSFELNFDQQSIIFRGLKF